MQEKKLTKIDMIQWLQTNCGIADTPLSSRIWHNSTYAKVKAVYEHLKVYHARKQRVS